MIDVSGYSSLLFDCDGVLLNSNGIKTQAFYHAAIIYGKRAAESLVEYHINHGGISRYEKFDHFLKMMAPVSVEDQSRAVEELLDRYVDFLQSELIRCEVAEGLSDLRDLTKESVWYVVSGGDQEELRQLFTDRKLAGFFDGGIYGSPRNKDEILSSLNIGQPALFFGDSQYDFEAAKRTELEFCFVSDWSESRFDFCGADFRINRLRDLLPGKQS